MDLSQLERLAEINISAIFCTENAQADLKWSQAQLNGLPDDVAASLFKEYLRRWRGQSSRAHRSANIWLRRRVTALKAMLHKFPIPIWHIATEVRRSAIAHEWADRCATLLHNATEFGSKQLDALELIIIVKQPAGQWGFCPVLPSFREYETRKNEGEFDADPTMYNMIAGAIARLTDEAWWLRKLERSYRQYQEHAAIVTGKVRAGVSAYVSHHCLKDYKQRKLAAAAWLKEMQVVNEELGLEMSLADAVAASVANPENRRAELMVRMRGFEDVAEETGFVGEFYTWTAPSRFHSWKKSKKGPSYANGKYQGANPKDTQAYLCGQWAKARAKLAREEIELFGFRVVEPHHDGTPHWHLLLFIRPDQLRQARSIMRRYALQHDKHDLAPAKGKKHPKHTGYRPRFDFKTIDPEKGSATGYIAKYIAKNIDGAYIDDDFESEESGKHGAQGVAAWSSTWNIRQFQQIGGPSVTVWRELRRLREEVEGDEILERARAACDGSNWQRYIEIMGGACCKRADRTVILAKVVNDAANQYGEDVSKIMGVMSRENHTPFNTRIDGWEIRAPRDNCEPDAFDLALDCSFDSKSDDNRAPWSSDNNCTGLIKTPEKDRKGIDLNDRQLIAEGKKLGLDKASISRLRAGAVIDNSVDGARQYVSLRNGMLITSKQPPMSKGARAAELDGWHYNHSDPLIDSIKREEDAGWNKLLRQQAWALLDKKNNDRHGDVELWLADIPVNHQRRALKQLQEVIELQEFDNSLEKHRSSQAHADRHVETEEDEYELF
ncbi:replication endonuclease [Shewanella sp.]|uniref:replication endonuclease n=1 Tax=Shewanella sp. TaxID=50422 RepID=UPI001EB65107|nr:replication endonuclease [Shewanella sp.]NRB24058.1 replication endonuclease [Shewanella sp.]